jgi:glycosyltransferase involved in cell wall biosynthesis
MKILFFQRQNIWGGSVRSLHLLASELAREHEVVLGYFGRGAPAYAGAYRSAGIELVPLGVRFEDRFLSRRVARLGLRRGAPTLLAAPRMMQDTVPVARRVARLVRELRPDVVHTNESLRANRAEILGAVCEGVPVVSHTRAILPLSRVDRLVARDAARIIAVSRAAAQPYLDIGMSPAVVRVVPNCVPVPARISAEGRKRLRFELGLAEEACWALTSGRLIPWKGNLEAIRAVRVVRDHGLDLRLVVLGEGPQRNELEQEVSAMGLSAHVVFGGWQDDPVPFLRAVDVALLPSQSPDPFPRSVIEAMACGLPVVATEYGGAQEAFRDGVSGILVRGPGHLSLAEGLARLARLPDLRQCIANEARAHAERSFSPAAHAQQVLEIYDEIRDRRDASPAGRRSLRTLSP